MASREQAIALAKSDTPAALACAREIPEPWYRCQALGWVARFAPDADVIRIATEALQAAAAGLDGYQRVAAASWPIRALIERHELTAAELATLSIVPRANDIEHTGARAEALIHLLQATLPAPRTTWQPVLDALLGIPQSPMHWRHGRALRNSIEMVRAKNAELAAECQARVTDDKIRRRLAQDTNNRYDPRAFFW